MQQLHSDSTTGAFTLLNHVFQGQLQPRPGSVFGGFGPASEDGGVLKSFDGLSLQNSAVGCAACDQALICRGSPCARADV